MINQTCLIFPGWIPRPSWLSPPSPGPLDDPAEEADEAPVDVVAKTTAAKAAAASTPTIKAFRCHAEINRVRTPCDARKVSGSMSINRSNLLLLKGWLLPP